MEDWEITYNLKTSILKRISGYTGLDFNQVMNIPYSYFLLLNKESWIYSYQTAPGGSGLKILKDLWRLQQTEADENSVRDYIGKDGA